MSILSILWEPITFIFRGYNPYFEGLKLKTLIFHGFGVQGYVYSNQCVDPRCKGNTAGYTSPHRQLSPCDLPWKDLNEATEDGTNLLENVRVEMFHVSTEKYQSIWIYRVFSPKMDGENKGKPY